MYYAPLQSSLTYQAIGYAYETLCSSGAECADALVAYHANTTCLNALFGCDAEIYCTETCINNTNTVLSVCPNVSSSGILSL